MKSLYFWRKRGVSGEIGALLRNLGEEYPLTEGVVDGGIELKFAETTIPGLVGIENDGSSITITAANVSLAARGIGTVLSGISGIKRHEEKIEFKTFGIMLDCSRNAVMTVSSLRKWLRRLALSGYNMVMLYTEDTYELPDEPYFGYCRGAYSARELREIDTFAATLGIEMIPCIQTLGHLEQILKWQAYDAVKDTARVLLAEEKKTYELIEKMIAFWRSVFRTKRMHIGQDETLDLGRGRYHDRFGCVRSFDIFNRHLKRVTSICRKYGFTPMLWSDMYFRMGSKTHDYYDLKTIIPEDVVSAIPEQAQLVYWDYYHEEEQFYRDFIKLHRKIGREPVMASGIWTWLRLWYDHYKTAAAVKPCLAACRKEKVAEVIFTMWGDDGGYCNYDSALAGLVFAAELAFGGSPEEELVVGKRFTAICGGDYKLALRLGMMENMGGGKGNALSAPAVLWDDPLLGIYWRNREIGGKKNFWLSAEKYYVSVLAWLPSARQRKRLGEDYVYAGALTDLLYKKIALRRALLAAWKAGDREKLASLKDKMIPEVIKAVETFFLIFRTQWLRRNKPFGMEVTENRLSGLAGRYRELALRLSDFLEEKIIDIPELNLKIVSEQPFGSCYHKYFATGSSIN